ncbi:hypothetical protein RND81_05G170800 [Saponaria officinalis]|uniref:Post-GPI attachment to proteins factor 3 n=1 Tax=Saponaria officinalis TaxID=3572 RepID=A0AAW1KYY7_SAPOF
MEDGIPSFWDPVTSTIDGCEKNYACFLALFGLINTLRQRFGKRFSFLHISNMALAIGNMLYHATLQCKQQHSDKTPMVWEMLLYLYILYSPDWHYKSTMPTFIFLYGAAFGLAHHLVGFDIGFKAHYMILCLLCIPRMYKYYIHTQDIYAKGLAKLYLLTLLLGSLYCWYFNPQGHALWHIFMGFNSHFANTFLMFCRAQQLGWEPTVVGFMGVLPYVKVNKTKTQ